jgi:hypothetical protein
MEGSFHPRMIASSFFFHFDFFFHYGVAQRAMKWAQDILYI